MINPIGKTFHRLGMQPPGCSFDDHVLRDIGLTRVEYRFLPMSRATTDPDRSQKTAGIFTVGRRFLSLFQA